MAQVVAVSRQVNELDTKGKLIIMRDLQAQGLENAKERPVSNATVMEPALVELFEAAGVKVVDVTTYKEAQE